MLHHSEFLAFEKCKLLHTQWWLTSACRESYLTARKGGEVAPYLTLARKAGLSFTCKIYRKKAECQPLKRGGASVD